MATATRTKENNCDFPLFKTPLRTPIRTPSKNKFPQKSFLIKSNLFIVRSGIISSSTLNDLAFYSNNLKPLKFISTTSMNDLHTNNDIMTTPIRSNKTKFSTPGSIPNRRALGLVNYNSNVSSNDESSTLIPKHDESVILQAPAPKTVCSHPEDDLPCESKNHHFYQDTFDDLIPTDERIERMVLNQINGINIFPFSGGIENTIRCQSPQCSRVDLSTLLDILN